MKCKRFLALALGLTLLLCTLVACGEEKEETSGTEDKQGTYEIPAEYAYSYTEDGVTTNAKITVEFKESQLTVTVDTDSADSEERLTRTTAYLLDEYGNVVRELSYINGELRYIDDYAYDANARPTVNIFHYAGTAPDSFDAYAYEGDTVSCTSYSDQGPQGSRTFERIYDASGRLLKESGSTYEDTYEYDEHGYLTKQRSVFAYGGGLEATFRNEYKDGKLSGITVVSDEMEAHVSVEAYKSFKLTEGQYRCALLMPMLQKAEVFRGKAGGSSELRYADGAALKAIERDGDGNTVKETYYLPDGKVDYIRTYTYESGKLAVSHLQTANGEQTLALEYDEDGSLSNPYADQIEYDEQGNVIREARYDVDTEGWTIREYQYDGQGNLIWEATHHDNAGVRYSQEYEYDAQGNVIRDKIYDDSSEDVIEREYYYNERGDELQIRHYSNGEIYAITDYEYDGNGNCVKIVKASTYGVLQFLRESEFDEDGTCIMTRDTSFNMNGTVDTVEEIRYIDDEQILREYEYEDDGSYMVWVRVQSADENRFSLTDAYGYQADGTLLYRVEYEDGTPVRTTYYNPDGSVESIEEE